MPEETLEIKFLDCTYEEVLEKVDKGITVVISGFPYPQNLTSRAEDMTRYLDGKGIQDDYERIVDLKERTYTIRKANI